MPKRDDHYYLTTPIYYVNDVAHVGHAYTSIASDIMARFQRLLGKQEHFVTGTDEHGQKIARAAEARGVGPQTFVDEISEGFRELNKKLNTSTTDFIRTTEPRHLKAAQKIWEAANAAGDIYKKSYEGLYCVSCEQFYIEKDLNDGVCPIHLKAPELLQEENYFFKLSKYTEPLKKYFDAHPDFVYPQNRQKEMRQILEEGLDDISISRSVEKLSWGIPVPGDDTQVMYVWFDALTNYITAAGYADDEKFFDTWWPADAHVMGKEINRFHSLLWPAMLLSAGLPLPKQIVVHGWLTADGQKMSKSIGNVIKPYDVIEKYGLDTFRYFLFRELPFGSDGDFSFAKLEQRYRSDLGNDLGNLVMRTVAMTQKFCAGVVPSETSGDHEEIWDRYRAHMERWEFQSALELVWEYVRGLNQLIDHEKPWAAEKEGRHSDVEKTLYTILEGLRHIAIALQPFMPETADKILAQLGFEYFNPQFDTLQEWGLLKSGVPLIAAPPLFPPLTE
ncbi:MAG: methionine--tRNA ligase [Candidatus Magasanikbacteria bacterium RIFCSPHIGHO2_01_FULL_50_8]|uniref:Methionine--tRNA ligase n=1 Tax=Candidatus Magasanikbacteria bacterium RIFCSPHIGHO2_01_FULL_50_8 TaxID=1798674 RepID=A0A1F6LVL2_9BACT|nr:MAG: methionine--tRNA ligase [Candidatus Magasanikbacteria bacterium RIFCSPHIGHO2_01_FULL_50_8]